MCVDTGSPEQSGQTSHCYPPGTVAAVAAAAAAVAAVAAVAAAAAAAAAAGDEGERIVGAACQV